MFHRFLVCVGVCLALSSVCAAEDITVENVSGGLNDAKTHRRILVRFSADISSFVKELQDKSHYRVTEKIANPSGSVVPAVEEHEVSIRKIELTDNEVIALEFEGAGSGQGTFRIEDIKLTADKAIKNDEWPWFIKVGFYDLQGWERDGNINFRGKTPVLEFSVARTKNFHWEWDQQRNAPKNVHRDWFNIEGSVPLSKPQDVKNTPGANTDASGNIADFVKASYTRRWYNRSLFQSLGLLARATGRLNGLEVVGRYDRALMSFAGKKGAAFLGAETEFGYRSGDAEWINLTTPAPDRGNIVARAGGVVEFAPRLQLSKKAVINNDLGSGLRFFVRGRGWADYAKDATGSGDVRLRGFLDTELFYNINPQFRVFLRHETGYLPPDLSRRVQRTLLGMGTAF